MEIEHSERLKKRIAPVGNYWVSRSKCLTIPCITGRSNRTRTEKRPLDLAIGMRS